MTKKRQRTLYRVPRKLIIKSVKCENTKKNTTPMYEIVTGLSSCMVAGIKKLFQRILRQGQKSKAILIYVQKSMADGGVP